MITVSVLEMVQILVTEKRTPFVRIKSLTNCASALKTSKVDGSINPYYKGLKKYGERNFRIVNDYSKRVNKNLLAEGKPADFVPKAPKGKKHIGNCILTDTATESKYYLMVEFYPNVKGKNTYYGNDNIVEYNEIAKFFSDTVYTQNGLEKPINILTFDISNIKYLHHRKQIYKIV